MGVAIPPSRWVDGEWVGYARARLIICASLAVRAVSLRDRAIVRNCKHAERDQRYSLLRNSSSLDALSQQALRSSQPVGQSLFNACKCTQRHELRSGQPKEVVEKRVEQDMMGPKRWDGIVWIHLLVSRILCPIAGVGDGNVRCGEVGRVGKAIVTTRRGRVIDSATGCLVD